MEERLLDALHRDAPPPPIDEVRRRGRHLRARRRALVGTGVGAVAAVIAVVAVLATGPSTERVEVDTDLAAALDASAFADGYTLLAYLEPTATAGEILAVELTLSMRQDVVGYEYLDQAAAFGEYRRLFADQPALVETVQPSDLPPSFRIRMDAGCGTALAEELEAMAGMYKVIRTPHGC